MKNFFDVDMTYNGLDKYVTSDIDKYITSDNQYVSSTNEKPATYSNISHEEIQELIKKSREINKNSFWDSHLFSKSAVEVKIDESKTKKVDICPPGFKPLREKDVVKSGDIFINVYTKGYFEATTEIGKIYSKKGWMPGFRKNKPNIDYTEEQKQEMINKLKKLKAFNRDSAFRVSNEDFDICEYLNNYKLIECICGNKFYIEEKICS